MNYWIAKVTDRECFKYALQHNCWLTQQRYSIQDNRTVSNTLGIISEIKENDCLLLTYGDKIFAYGQVVQCLLETKQYSVLQNVIQSNRHDYDSGIVRFNDSPVYYENLENGEEDWGQRINVGRWTYFVKETSVKTSGVKEHCCSGIVQLSIYGIDEEFGRLKINELKKQYEMNNHMLISTKELLETNHNLILTGAPGTGKTYLAQQIAQQMIFGSVKEEKDFTPDEKKQFEEQCAFVQFHPSYDYTDFVEGLRPIQDDNGNVGFERRDGAFKEFCKKALKCNKSGAADNFDEVWDKLVEKLNNETVIDVPMLSGNNIIKLELNVTGTGLAERTYEDQSQVGQKTWIVGQSKFFSKEQLYRIYKGGKGVPSGGHDNYRKAIVKYMIENLGLVQYKEGAFIQEETHRNFVFIIDEINRGEISKIFGELFFSIDPGYRGKNLKVKTQYQNLIDEDDDFCDGFYVPENVYIIGTMNDIDRSVESMDFAMRRRFAFKEISAESRVGMIEENGKLSKFSEDIIKRMTNLNNCILTIQGLSSAYQIGAAYYLKLENYLEKGQLTELSWTNLWENHIKGLLFEYLRGTPNASVDLEEKLQPAFELKDMYEKVEGKVVKK